MVRSRNTLGQSSPWDLVISEENQTAYLNCAMVTYCSVISLSVKEDGMRKVERLKKRGCMYMLYEWVNEACCIKLFE